MEKRRRARINASLTELKSLLMDAIKKEGARQNKMEKADILEMAVKHLRQIQRQQFTGESSRDTPDINKYHLGFHACVQEVCTYLDSNRDEDLELKTKLLNHLANCMTSTNSQSTASTSSSSPMLTSTSTSLDVPVSIPASYNMPLQSFSPTVVNEVPEVKSSLRLEYGAAESSSVDASKQFSLELAKDTAKSKSNIATSSSDVIKQQGILHAVLTSSTPTVKQQMLPLSPPGSLIDHTPAPNRAQDNHNIINTVGTSQISPVTEINNNSIILPTFLKVGTPTSLTCIQQPNQLQPTHLYQHQLNQAQIQQHCLPQFPDGSNIFTSVNPFQLIPTKTANGDIAFLLSTTNFINSSHIPTFTFPVLTPPTVGNAQILSSPISQQAIQILSCTPEEQNQSISFMSPSMQPLIHPANKNVEIITTSTPNILQQTTPNILQQTTPLNLSSNSNKTTLMTHSNVVTFPTTVTGNADKALSFNKKLSYASKPTSTLDTKPSYPSSINKNITESVNLIQSTRLTNWNINVSSHSTSSTPSRPSESFLSDLMQSNTGSHHEVSSFHKTEPAVCQSQPIPTSNTFMDTDNELQNKQIFRPWKE
uniref:BHLH domain-containing protein n=1 Tax=Arion vulgaris TaxID=1028688 RepID=A0A0B7A017_9EUPU